jgi:hypothetical protein
LRQIDGDCGVRRAGGAEDVESVLGKRQFGVHDGLAADLPHPRDEPTRLLDGNQ